MAFLAEAVPKTRQRITKPNTGFNRARNILPNTSLVVSLAGCRQSSAGFNIFISRETVRGLRDLFRLSTPRPTVCLVYCHSSKAVSRDVRLRRSLLGSSSSSSDLGALNMTCTRPPSQVPPSAQRPAQISTSLHVTMVCPTPKNANKRKIRRRGTRKKHCGWNYLQGIEPGSSRRKLDRTPHYTTPRLLIVGELCRIGIN